MKPFYLILAVILFFSFLPAEKLSAQTDLVFITEVDGEIKAGTLQYLKRAVKEAQAGQADYLIIKLDTLGGLLKPTQDIVDLLLQTEVKTVVFVYKDGGRAFSAGTFILFSSDYAFVNPTASIGAAQPVAMFNQSGESEKTVSATAAWIRGLAQERDPQTAEKFVRENLSLTGKEAQEAGIIDGTVNDLEELFSELGVINPRVTKVAFTPIESFFDLLSHPYLVSLFLTLGGLGLILAFRTGEFEVTGLVALIFLLMGLWGMGVITFNVLGIVFLVLGIVFLFLEILEPGFGVFGFFGIVFLVFGVFALEAEPFLQPGIFDAATMLVFGALTGIIILFVIISRGALKSFKIKPKTGTETLIGLEAEVIEKLDLVGRVKIKQETWRAESLNGKAVPEKAKVKIVKVEGNTLFVENLQN